MKLKNTNFVTIHITDSISNQQTTMVAGLDSTELLIQKPYIRTLSQFHSHPIFMAIIP
jgi:hypothetical protein